MEVGLHVKYAYAPHIQIRTLWKDNLIGDEYIKNLNMDRGLLYK